MLFTEHLVQSWSQCKGSQPAGQFLSHPGQYAAITCLQWPSQSTNITILWQYQLYCLVTEALRCAQLAQGRYAALSRWELNPRHTDHKFNALPLHHCAASADDHTSSLFYLCHVARHTVIDTRWWQVAVVTCICLQLCICGESFIIKLSLAHTVNT